MSVDRVYSKACLDINGLAQIEKALRSGASGGKITVAGVTKLMGDAIENFDRAQKWLKNNGGSDVIDELGLERLAIAIRRDAINAKEHGVQLAIGGERLEVSDLQLGGYKVTVETVKVAAPKSPVTPSTQATTHPASAGTKASPGHRGFLSRFFGGVEKVVSFIAKPVKSLIKWVTDFGRDLIHNPVSAITSRVKSAVRFAVSIPKRIAEWWKRTF